MDQKCLLNHTKLLCENSVINVPKLLNESMLIKKLESYNIGRPSTYASIIQSLESKYISVEPEQLIGCFNNEKFQLEDNNIVHTNSEKKYMRQKNIRLNEKGVNAIKYLSQHFQSIFDYDFTTKMEMELDDIANGKQTNIIFVINLTPMLDKVINETNNTTNDYKITNTLSKINLGKHENNAIYLCKGKFGYYLEHKKEKYSIDESIISKSETFDTVNYDINMAIAHIQKMVNEKNNKILRKIDKDSSIRLSSHGHYIYYKTQNMKKPKFISLNNLNDVDYLTCELNVLSDYINQEKNKTKPKYRKYKNYKK